MSKFMKSDLLLLFTAIIWGSGFVAQRLGMDYIGPATFNALRFLLGVLILVPLVHKLSPVRSSAVAWRGLVVGGAVTGFFMFLGSWFQTWGLVTTTAGKAGFITGLYVVLVPILGLFWGQRTGISTWLGLVLSTVGLYLLSVTGDFQISLGDLLILLSAIFWAAQIQTVSHYSKKIDPLMLAVAQFIFSAIYNFVVAVVMERDSFTRIGDALPAVVYSGIFVVAIAFTLQVVAQKDAHPADAAIIMSLETVFAAFFGWLLLREGFTTRSIAGSLLMLAGMLVSQVGDQLKVSLPGIFRFRSRDGSVGNQPQDAPAGPTDETVV